MIRAPEAQRAGLRAALLGITLLLLAGCQSLPPPASASLPPSQTLTVPFVPQQQYQCGPAALAMMLQWAGKPVDAESLVEEVWLPGRKGSLGVELRAAARSRGLLAYPVEDSEALFAELQAGRPVLVLQNLALPSWPKWHFAVVTGYQQQGQRMVLHSGTSENQHSHWNRFIRTWARADYWGFTLVAPGELPASAEPHALFRAISALPDGQAFWPAAVQAFPNHGELWFGYGNSLWSEGWHQAARKAFSKATAADPELAAAWNNRAYAELAAGDDQAAQYSLCQALALEPDNPEILASQQELGYSCPSVEEDAASSGCCASN